MTLMTETVPAQPASPSLTTIARLVEQGIEEQRETRERLDAHIQISTVQFDGLHKMVDGVRSESNAQYLMLAGQLAETRKHVDSIEEHVGFLTMKVVGHDKRFDAVDSQLRTIAAGVVELRRLIADSAASES